MSRETALVTGACAGMATIDGQAELASYSTSKVAVRGLIEANCLKERV